MEHLQDFEDSLPSDADYITADSVEAFMEDDSIGLDEPMTAEAIARARIEVARRIEAAKESLGKLHSGKVGQAGKTDVAAMAAVILRRNETL